MSRKLWIMWGLLAVTCVLAGALGQPREVIYGFAIASATAGWAAFLLR